MEHLKGKKLLILGASQLECLIVDRAKGWGIYTIVTDYNKDWDLSPAKKVADEAWDVSWSELDTLQEKCVNAGVAGVVAGFSEFRVDNAIALCKRLQLPFYAGKEQLELTRSKNHFKDHCRKYGVPVVPAYDFIQKTEDIDAADIAFPVIVKPVDRAGSIGISICHDKEELKQANDYALSLSASKQTMIEKFMDGCSEFNAYYMIQEGRAILACTADKVNSRKEHGEKIVPNAEVYPSIYQQDFLEKVHDKMKAMIEALDIRNGCIFLTGFVDQDRSFFFFETGFRLSTELSYYFIKSKCKYDALDLILYSSFFEDTSALCLDDVTEQVNQGSGATLYSYAKPGRLAAVKFDVPEDLAEHINCLNVYLHAGDMVEEKDSTFYNAATCCIHGADRAELSRLVRRYYDAVELKDDQGRSLLYDRLDCLPER